MQPLDAREWLESQRLAGCEWAPELLETLDQEPDGNDAIASLEWLKKRHAPDIVNGSALGDDKERLTDWISDRLALLESIEEILGEFSEGFEFDSRTIDPDDKLRAMFESERWQKYDL